MAVEQEIEEFEAYRISGAVQAVLDLAHAAGFGVVVGDQGVEEVGEAGERGLAGFGAVEVSVVDCLAVGRVSKGRYKWFWLR